MTRIAAITAITIMLALASRPALGAATSFIVPSEWASAEAPGNNIYPFSSTNNFRLQQVYLGSDMLAGPYQITGIVMRPDASGNTFGGTIGDVDLYLSTTSKTPSDLSTTFASNLGADVQLVYTGALTLDTAFSGPVAGPKNFDLLIQFQTPFSFDPAAGNLLLEMRKFSPDVAAGIIDFVFATDDSVGRVLSHSGSGGSANSATGSVDEGGMVTRFLVVPEPDGAALALAALGALAALFRASTSQRHAEAS